MDIIKFDSALGTNPIEIRAPYYNAINPTKVYFEQEKVSVCVDSLGHVEFFDENEESIGFVDFPVSNDPSEYAHTAQYGECHCFSNGKTATVFLPVYWWGDSYPNCDGESDRWTRHVKRRFRIVLDIETREISVHEKDI